MPGATLPVPSDQDLLAAVQHGDEEAFRLLYRRHTPRLQALLLRLLGGHHADADDALQESWIRAVRGLERFRGDSRFSTWLGGIGVRVTWELIRRRLPDGHLELDDLAAALGDDPVGRVDLERALARLPDAYRLVVVLHDVEGYTHGEIAETLGIAEGTSKSHLFRARRLLRSELDSWKGATP